MVFAKGMAHLIVCMCLSMSMQRAMVVGRMLVVGVVLWRSNIWIACGLHSAWNFILYVIMGLNLSGSESVSKGVVLFSVQDTSILNGADYGIEASVITTVVLGMLLFVMVKGWNI